MEKITNALDEILIEADDTKLLIEAYEKVAAIYSEYELIPQESDMHRRIKALESNLTFLRDSWRQLSRRVEK